MGAEAILLGSSTTSFPDLQKQVANLPVIELVNAIDAPGETALVPVSDAINRGDIYSAMGAR